MPKANFKLPTHYTQSKMDEVLNFFLQKGQFILTNGIVAIEALDGCINYLKQQPYRLNTRDRKIFLKNITFDVGPVKPESLRSYRDEKIFDLLNEIFAFSSRWSVISLDNVTILHDGNHYSLSPFSILEFPTSTCAIFNQ